MCWFELAFTGKDLGMAHALEAVCGPRASRLQFATVTCHVFHCRVRVAPGSEIPDGSFLSLEHCHHACAPDGTCMHVCPVAVPLRSDDSSVSLPAYGDAASGTHNALHLLWGTFVAGDQCGARACAVSSGQHIGVGHVFAFGPFSVEIVRIEDVQPRDPAAISALVHENAWQVAEDLLDDHEDDRDDGAGTAKPEPASTSSHPGAGDHPCAWYHVRHLDDGRLPPLRMAEPDRVAYDRALAQVDAIHRTGDDGYGLGVSVWTFARAAVRASRIVLGPVFVDLEAAASTDVLFVHPTRLVLPLAEQKEGAKTTPHLALPLVLYLIRARLAALGRHDTMRVELVRAEPSSGASRSRAFLVFRPTVPVGIHSARHPGARLPVCAVELNARTPSNPLDPSTGIPALDAELQIQRDLLACNTRI